MSCVNCRTQAELDAALEQPGACPHLVGDGYFVVRGSATVEAWDSATVEAWGSATVRAWGSATVEAWDSATVRARDSATVRARDSATVEAWDSATVEAWGGVMARLFGNANLEAKSQWVVTTVHGKRAKAAGGQIIAMPDISTVANWLEWYGIEVTGKGKSKLAQLFKAVDAEFKSGHGTSYRPGEEPEAEDWDGGQDCCGGGLHFSPSPIMARSYAPDATKFVRCPALVSDLAVITDYGGTSDKVKAKKVTGEIVEVDIDGESISGE